MQEVGGSSPLTPTKAKRHRKGVFLLWWGYPADHSRTLVRDVVRTPRSKIGELAHQAKSVGLLTLVAKPTFSSFLKAFLDKKTKQFSLLFYINSNVLKTIIVFFSFLLKKPMRFPALVFCFVNCF